MSKSWYRFLAVVGVLIVLLGFAYYFYPAIRDRLFPAKDLNVILISIDAARADRFSFNGFPARLTPNIDHLAKSGAVFRRAYCYGGNTPSSMGAIFTSKFPYWPPKVPGGGGRWANKQVYGLTRFFPQGELRPGIPDTLETLPTIFKKHGYTTVGISTNPYLSQDFNFDRGFDFFEEAHNIEQSAVPYAGVEEVMGTLLVYLSELRDEKFFAWVHLMDLHAPLVGYGPFREEAKSRTIGATHQPLRVPEWTQYAKDNMNKFGARNLPDREPTEESLQEALEQYVLAYDAELLRIDKQIGVLMDALQQNDLWDNTLVVIVNDHGDEFMEHGDWTHRGQLYEQIVRGVWIMHNPKLFRKPVTVEEPVSQIDLLPTLLDLLRLTDDDLSFDGESRLSLLKKKPSGGDRYVFGVLDQRAYVIEGDYKLIVTNHLGEQAHGITRHPPRVSFQLYNLREDPGEQKQLAKEFPQVVDRLYVKLRHAFLKEGIHFWRTRSQSRGVSKETQERLRSLGYVQ